ncbi:MAG: hypothetical protein DMG07_05030 [Acidobacteria bacterium]|nr:MAG: hypothetical protein DMG07_05030 [Acidobacteriota bacterium]
MVACLATPLLLAALYAQDRPPLAWREDWKETPAALPITQEHVANADLILELHGPGRDGIKKSHHDTPKDDPYYVWSGECRGAWAVSLRHRSAWVDLTGLGRVRWRARQEGFRRLRLILRLHGPGRDGIKKSHHDTPKDDPYYVWSGECRGAWAVSLRHRSAWVDLTGLGRVRWRRLDIEKVVEGPWVENPDLGRVEAIGFTDLMSGGGTPASSRLDWIEVWGKLTPRAPR